MLTLKTLYTCLRDAVVSTIHHDGIEHAGYLAFLAMLALFPFLVFLFALVGFMGQGEAGAVYIAQILHMLPGNVALALQPRIDEIVSGPPQGLLTVSILGAIWTASSALEGMRTTLNRAYHVATPPAYLLRRALSIVELLVFTFITISLMLLVVTVPLFIEHMERLLNITLSIFDKDYVNRVVMLASVGGLFWAVSAIYYVLPNIKQRMVSVMPGAALVVLFWLGAAQIFTFYLSHFNQVNLIYGSLGGLIAALLFFYICNMIFIFGAEFNYQIVRTLGMRIEEKEEVVSEV